MDVTFFENQPFFPKTDIQGDNYTQEYQLSDIDVLESSSGNDVLPSSVSPKMTNKTEQTDLVKSPQPSKK